MYGSSAVRQITMMVIKALIEGRAVAVAAVFIAKHTLPVREVLSLAVTAAIVFLILDSNVLPPTYGVAARQGAGFGLGANLVRFPAA